MCPIRRLHIYVENFRVASDTVFTRFLHRMGGLFAARTKAFDDFAKPGTSGIGVGACRMEEILVESAHVQWNFLYY
jgi:hypothetical protein